MRRSNFSDQQNAFVLRQAEEGVSVIVCQPSIFRVRFLFVFRFAL